MKTNRTEHYNWNTHINDKAIVEFERGNNLSENRMNWNRYYLLSYLMGLYIDPKKGNKIKTEYIEDKKHIYVSSSFILNNLLLLKVEERTLIRMLLELENCGYINRVVIKKVFRYVRISDALLHHCCLKNYDALRPKKLNHLAKKVGNYFGKTDGHQLSDVYEFLDQIENIETFAQTFNEYKAFKEYSNESIPRFKTFSDDWDQQNWSILLEQLKYKDMVNKFENY